MGSAADLLEVFGIVSGDEHCGAKDVLDVLDVVAHVVVEEGWDSCGFQDPFMAFDLWFVDSWKLGFVCMGDDQ